MITGQLHIDREVWHWLRSAECVCYLRFGFRCSLQRGSGLSLPISACRVEVSAATSTATVVNVRRRSSMWTANQEKCLRAHFQVMRKALNAATEDRHRKAIAERLWHVVAGSASFLDWRTADQAAAVGHAACDPSSAPTGYAFKALCSLSPRFAVRAREGLIRTLKPATARVIPAGERR